MNLSKLSTLLLAVCILAITACEKQEISPILPEIDNIDLRIADKKVPIDNFLSRTVDNYDATSAYNDWVTIYVPHFYDGYWSYGTLYPTSSSNNILIPFENNGTLINPLGTTNIEVLGYAAIDPDDPLGGYLPIPDAIATDLEQIPVSASSNPNDDPLGGYLPIPDIIVNYNDNGTTYTINVQPNTSAFVNAINKNQMVVKY